MKRNSFTILGIGLITVLVGLLGSFYWALFQVPDFYQMLLTEQSDAVMRAQAAQSFARRSHRLADEMKYADTWSEEFTQPQINSWLAETVNGKRSRWIPSGVSDPRVKLSDDVVQLGFRLDRGGWDGVISLHLKPEVPKKNQLSIEVQSVHAGLIPIPIDTIMEHISEYSRRGGWQLEWDQADGRNVVTIQLDKNANYELVLDTVDVTDGAIRIAGHRREPTRIASLLNWRPTTFPR